MAEKGKNTESDTREFDQNPYTPDTCKPEDVVRLFYTHNVPILPVISRRGTLIGVLRKEDVISELSDIERAETLKIDRFITGLAKKMTLDDLLPYGTIREFIVISIFGEVEGTWPRMKLFNASESGNTGAEERSESDLSSQKEEQILEWMIYLILEHIPRPLYAVNQKGGTIFYNSHFEDIYTEIFRKEVDHSMVEKSIKDSDRNELLSENGSEDLCFYNTDLRLYYEKVPLMSGGKSVGFLLFCNREKASAGSGIQGLDMRGKSLGETMESLERQIIVSAIKRNGSLGKTAEELKISRKTLSTRIQKYGIDTGKE